MKMMNDLFFRRKIAESFRKQFVSNIDLLMVGLSVAWTVDENLTFEENVIAANNPIPCI